MRKTRRDDDHLETDEENEMKKKVVLPFHAKTLSIEFYPNSFRFENALFGPSSTGRFHRERVRDVLIFRRLMTRRTRRAHVALDATWPFRPLFFISGAV